MIKPLDEIVRLQKSGKAAGMSSICSAHPAVLKAVLRGESPVLIESTCNQVNQFGGYTGMTPADFASFVCGLAAKCGFPVGKLILGGDHLGPSPWQNEPAESALNKSADMVRAFVQAGFTKIHLDASMRLGDDDPGHPLEVELAAERTARLVEAAEAAAHSPGDLRYVFGTEVPTPGGATRYEECVSVTRMADARYSMEVTHAAFLKRGLEAAWERVMAMVVQPGVEFGDDFVADYQHLEARDLATFSETTPFVFEAHSTDYQQRDNLRALVRDHFAILKVGPALTFAYREAVFALARMEAELFPADMCSQIIETLEQAMLRRPEHWQGHYHGAPTEQAFARKYSLSDRVRYYWPDPAVQESLGRLFSNLDRVRIPLSLLSQYLPGAFNQIRNGTFSRRAESMIETSIQAVLKDYTYACRPD
jgi:D-tagatose-1,6-bisphosphate aldolase subunit GatZ/KbaZ